MEVVSRRKGVTNGKGIRIRRRTSTSTVVEAGEPEAEPDPQPQPTISRDAVTDFRPGSSNSGGDGLVRGSSPNDSYVAKRPAGGDSPDSRGHQDALSAYAQRREDGRAQTSKEG